MEQQKKKIPLNGKCASLICLSTGVHPKECLCYLPVADAEDSAARAAPRRRTSIPSRLIFWFKVESGTWKFSAASV